MEDVSKHSVRVHADAETSEFEMNTSEAMNLDQHDMWRMGKKQELRRNFGPWALLGFASILGCTWQFTIFTVIWSLPNGGPAGAVYMFLACCVGLMFATLSLAEMASLAPTSGKSIAPTSGGQYHWISEFAPARVQKLLSYLVGWLTVLAWQVGLATTCYAAAEQIEGLAILVDPSIELKNWQMSLLTIAVCLVAVLFNTIFARQLPEVELVILVIHIAAYVAFEVVLLAMGPPSSRADVFETWENEYGWSYLSTAVLVGIIAPIITLTTADSVCHLAEESQNARRWLPRIMVGAAALNFSIGFLMLLTVLFRAGDIKAAINSKTGQPYIEILLNATGSRTGTAIMVAYIIFALVFCAVNAVTTSSRQLYSFARDGGVPFSKSLSKVSSKYTIPTNAIVTTFCFVSCLSLILIGSDTAFNIIASIGGSALLGSYIVSISTITYRKIVGYRIPASRWSLGKYGIVINILALAFLWLAFVMVFFPSMPNPDPKTMNWSSLIFGVVILGALAFLAVKQHRVYSGPVVAVREAA